MQAGAQLLEVGDPKALEIAVDVLTSDAVHIQAGAPVRVEEWGGPALLGVVRQIEPSAFTRLSALGVEEQRVNVVVDLQRLGRCSWSRPDARICAKSRSAAETSAWPRLKKVSLPAKRSSCTRATKCKKAQK